MPLVTGTKLGPYQIESPPVAGGMGEVYRARDTRLDRTVAVKVLPTHSSSDPELRQRFNREARAISSLQHPHICTLFDVGHENGIDYLVMEYLEGETLADRLKRGPLPLDQTLRIGIDIADALDRAHRRGIVHRDVKPGNVMLTKTGAKLMDFGLAKPAATAVIATGTDGLTISGTKPLTSGGTLVGTLQYMAPEQLEGKDTDARTDVFALGALIYETTAGKPAFSAQSPASLIAAILTAEPQPMADLQPLTPAALGRTVRKCLAKDPDERWQSVADLATELKWIAEGVSSPVPPAVVPLRRRRGALPWALAACGILAAIISFLLYWFQPRPVPSSVQAFIPPPEHTSFVFLGDAAGPVVLSRDGKNLAFVAADAGGSARIYVRPVNAVEVRALPDTDGAWSPFWSPDGARIGFFSDGKLKIIDVRGGGATAICDAPTSRGGSWGKDGTIIFAGDFRGPIYRVRDTGGMPSPVTKLEEPKHTSHRWPVMLPDGKHFLYLAINHENPQDENDGIYFASLDGKENRFLLRSYTNVSYASGFLLFVNNGQLEAESFDPETGRLKGEVRPVVNGITEDGNTWRAIFSASENGLLAYSGAGQPESQLAWVDRSGKLIQTVGEKLNARTTGPTGQQAFRVSPGADRVAISVAGATEDIWVMDLARGVRTRLTFGPVSNQGPVWSPDGKWIAYESLMKNAGVIKRRPADGGDEETVFSPSGTWPSPSVVDWSHDGNYLFLTKGGPGSRQEIWTLPLYGERKPFQLVPSGPYYSHYPYLSPNGRWLVYDSNESGRGEVYVISFPSKHGKRLVSIAGGTRARWRADGKEIYYVSLDGTLTAVAVTERGGQLKLGSPRPLFHFAGLAYDVSPDGRRFPIGVLTDANTAPITIVTDWAAELK